MLDLKIEADRMKDVILVKEVAEYNNDVEMNERYRRHQWRKRRCH